MHDILLCSFVIDYKLQIVALFFSLYLVLNQLNYERP